MTVPRSLRRACDRCHVPPESAGQQRHRRHWTPSSVQESAPRGQPLGSKSLGRLRTSLQNIVLICCCSVLYCNNDQPWAEASNNPPLTPFIHHGIRVTLGGTRRSIEEYIHLVQLQDIGVPDVEGKLRDQSIILLDDLRDLRKQVAVLCNAARDKRQRSWFHSVAM